MPSIRSAGSYQTTTPTPSDPADLALAAMLDRRQTARKPHLPRPIPAAVRDALIAEAERHDRVLTIATDRPTVRRLAALAGQATAALFADDAVHAELWRWLRLDPADPAYHRDGLTADCLELFGPARWLAQQAMPPARMRWICRLGLHHLLASDTAKVARRSAAICLLTTPVSGSRRPRTDRPPAPATLAARRAARPHHPSPQRPPRLPRDARPDRRRLRSPPLPRRRGGLGGGAPRRRLPPRLRPARRPRPAPAPGRVDRPPVRIPMTGPKAP